jgi:hypothetical protein
MISRIRERLARRRHRRVYFPGLLSLCSDDRSGQRLVGADSDGLREHARHRGPGVLTNVVRACQRA